MVQLDALGEGIRGVQHVDRVVRRVVLQDRLQDAVRVEPLLARNVQRLGHDVDQQAAIGRRAHDLDQQIFERAFREVGRRAQRVRVGTAGRLYVGSVDQRAAITGGEVGRAERIVVQESGDVLDRLVDGERVGFRAPLGHDLVEVVAQLLVGDDVPQRIRDVRVAGEGTLHFRVVGDRVAFRLDRREAESSDLQLFLVGLVGVVDFVQVSVLGRVLRVDLAPRRVNPRPE